MSGKNKQEEECHQFPSPNCMCMFLPQKEKVLSNGKLIFPSLIIEDNFPFFISIVRGWKVIWAKNVRFIVHLASRYDRNVLGKETFSDHIKIIKMHEVLHESFMLIQNFFPSISMDR